MRMTEEGVGWVIVGRNGEIVLALPAEPRDFIMKLPNNKSHINRSELASVLLLN